MENFFKRRFNSVPPSGVFEVVSDKIVGVIEDRSNPRKAPMVVVKKRGNVEIGRALAVVRSGSPHKFDFAMPLSDAITSVDILLERIVILAESDFGVSSQMTLDSSSKLALIRLHLGKPQVVLLDLNFSRGGNARDYQSGGWSTPEDSYCWTDGTSARLQFPISVNRVHRYELTIVCHPYLAPPFIISQTATITLNNYRQSVTLSNDVPGMIGLTYAAETLVDSDVVDITIDTPDARRPSDLEAKSDRRSLGFAFKRLTFARLLPVGEGR